jgi:hypothetical protein
VRVLRRALIPYPRSGVKRFFVGADPHPSTRKDQRVSEWAEADNVESAYVPFYASWLNRIGAQFTALRYFALNGTDQLSHLEQARIIRRYIAWRSSRFASVPTTIGMRGEAEEVPRPSYDPHSQLTE